MNEDKSSITTIGGQDCQKIPVGVLIVFTRKIGVKVKNTERERARVLEIILGMVKGEAFRTTVVEVSKREKTSSARTRPSALKSDGTLYRAVNAIMCEEGRGLFIPTRKQRTRQDVDSKKAYQSS